MAFIRKKLKKGNPYFYIVESYRKNGTIKQRTLEYIGTADNLAAWALKGWNADNAPENVNTAVLSFRSYSHGACMGMFYMAQSMGIEEMIDKCFKPKAISGMPRSRVLLLAMIHRAIDPGSKRSFAPWAKGTSLPYYLKFDAGSLDSAAFWEAMDGISTDEMTVAQRLIVDKAVRMTDADPKTFHLDYTNYFTFIDSKNSRCVICKRGHNKQGRHDLRQFSLAVLTTFALQIPLVWEMYDGNKNDKSEFRDFAGLVTSELAAHGIDPAGATVTFDGGGNSEENLADPGFHFICAHSMAGMKELYDIDISRYSEVDIGGDRSRTAFRIDGLEFSGTRGVGILTYSDELRDGQEAEMSRDIARALEACAEMNRRLLNPSSRIYTELKRREGSVGTAARKAREYNELLKQQEHGGRGRRKKEKDVPEWDEKGEILRILEDAIYKGRKYVREFSRVDISKGPGGEWEAALVIDEDGKGAYCRKYYGKKLTTGFFIIKCRNTR